MAKGCPKNHVLEGPGIDLTDRDDFVRTLQANTKAPLKPCAQTDQTLATSHVSFILCVIFTASGPPSNEIAWNRHRRHRLLTDASTLRELEPGGLTRSTSVWTRQGGITFGDAKDRVGARRSPRWRSVEIGGDRWRVKGSRSD